MDTSLVLMGIVFVFIILSLLVLLVSYAQRLNEHPSTQQLSRFPLGPARSALRSSFKSREPLPADLGVLPKEPFIALARRVERALKPDYAHQLKERVLAKHPELSPDWYEWLFLELKRFFVMTLVLRHVPMFSEEVDEIWHEMLLFTRNYQEFSTAVAGEMIHHTPYAKREPMPSQRAWFDWVYSQMFQFTPYSERIWNGFFRYPLLPSMAQEFARASEEELIANHFNERLAKTDPEVRSAIRELIASAKHHASAAPNRLLPEGQWRLRSGDLSLAGALLFAGAWMSLSEYQRLRDTALPPIEEKRHRRGDDGGCGACGGGAIDGVITDDDRGDWGGGDFDGGGCSGSSCGSGCSGGSSCGGGCGGGCGSG